MDTVVRAGRTALALGLSAALLAGCQTPEPEAPGTDSPGPTSSASPTPEPEPTPTATAVAGDVVVWAMTDTGTDLRLVRELHAVDDASVRTAVELMLAGPTDPDYASPWNPATAVLGVQEEPGAVVVDLTADARTASIGSAGAALMVEQLVWTVTDAVGDPATTVLLTIDGEPAGELWGAVVWDSPIARGEPLATRLLVQIDEPREGATSSSPVTISGEAAVFEANLPWRVLDEAGAQVAAGFTMTAEGQRFAPFSFTVDLPPGTYTVEITEDDPSDGEGRPPMVDTRTVTVG